MHVVTLFCIRNEKPVSAGFFIYCTPFNPPFNEKPGDFNRVPTCVKPCIVNLIKSKQMANLFRTRFGSVCIILTMAALSANANERTVQPEQFDLSVFIEASVSVLNGSAAKIEAILDRVKSRESSSICVCEVLELQNNNSTFTNVAIFAEKTNKGNIGNGYKIAERLIAREKKQMRSIYFDAVKINTKVAVASNCLSLYMKLKATAPGLKLYDILDADKQK